MRELLSGHRLTSSAGNRERRAGRDAGACGPNRVSVAEQQGRPQPGHAPRSPPRFPTHDAEGCDGARAPRDHQTPGIPARLKACLSACCTCRRCSPWSRPRTCRNSGSKPNLDSRRTSEPERTGPCRSTLDPRGNLSRTCRRYLPWSRLGTCRNSGSKPSLDSGHTSEPERTRPSRSALDPPGTIWRTARWHPAPFPKHSSEQRALPCPTPTRARLRGRAKRVGQANDACQKAYQPSTTWSLPARDREVAAAAEVLGAARNLKTARRRAQRGSDRSPNRS